MADHGPGSRVPVRANRPQLLTYPDSLGGRLADLAALLRGPLRGVFSGVHILPPYPSSGDRGFAPLTYDSIDPAFGSWNDVEELAETHAVLLDVMVNHISRHSPEFRLFVREGRHAATADLFITPDKVWNGDPPAADIARLFLRRTTGPFSSFSADTGEEITVWTTFGEGELSEQIDLDLASPAGRALVARWFAMLAGHGVSMIRLDAVGYVVKQAGSDCFMVEPEIWSFLDWATKTAEAQGLTLLPEVHDVQRTHEKLSERGLWTYDFVLPGLVLHAVTTGEAGRLATHLAAAPDRQVTTLDCHDGVPVLPDLQGVLTVPEMRALGDLAVERGGNINRILSRAHAVDGLDLHQLNLTYFSALGQDEERYLAARAIQLFARGIPQVYYVGLLAGSNDHAAMERMGDGRAVNRHDYSHREILEELRRPVVHRLLRLIELRNSHPAFEGTLLVTSTSHTLSMRWSAGPAEADLDVDLLAGTFHARATTDGVTWHEVGVRLADSADPLPTS